MTDVACDWLPSGAVEHPQMRDAIAAVVSEWSGHWFAASAARLADWRRADDLARAANQEWRDYPGGLRLSCDAPAAVRLALAVLDAPLPPPALTARDRQVVAALAERLLDDLAERLRRLFGPAPVGSTPGSDCIAVVDHRGDLAIMIRAPLACAVRLRRQALARGAARAPLPALSARSAAASATRLRLEMVLGEAQIGLTDLRQLAVGDLLVLDRRLGEPIDVRLAGTTVVRGSLTDLDGSAAVVLSAAPQTFPSPMSA